MLAAPFKKGKILLLDLFLMRIAKSLFFTTNPSNYHLFWIQELQCVTRTHFFWASFFYLSSEKTVMLTDLFEITEASVHFSAPFQMYLFGKVNNTQEKFHFSNLRKVNKHNIQMQYKIFSMIFASRHSRFVSLSFKHKYDPSQKSTFKVKLINRLHKEEKLLLN